MSEAPKNISEDNNEQNLNAEDQATDAKGLFAKPAGADEFPVFKAIVMGLLLILLIGGVSGGLFLNEKINLLNKTVVGGLTTGAPVSIDRRGTTETIVYEFGDREINLKEPYSSEGIYFWWEHVFISENKDAAGVYATYDAASGADRYDPGSIAVYGLGQYSNYIEMEDPVYLEEARIQADYLISVLDPQEGTLSFNFDMTINTGSANEVLKAPWISASAQGYACSLFARMYAQTGDKKYADAAALAIRPFSKTVEDGGLSREFQGHVFFETYPTELTDYELSGFMTALIGLFDVWQVTDNETAHALYTQGIETLEFSLPYFDSLGISYYQLSHLFRESGAIYIPGTAFHIVHIRQLEAINTFENSDRIAHYHDLWTAYIKGPKPQ